MCERFEGCEILNVQDPTLIGLDSNVLAFPAWFGQFQQPLMSFAKLLMAYKHGTQYPTSSSALDDAELCLST